MLPVLSIGPLALQTPGLVLLVGLWVGLSLSERLAARFKSDAAQIYNLIFLAIIAGILGARASYALQHFDAFRSNLLNLISLNPGLLDPLGGFLVGITAGAIYGKRKNLGLWNTLDGLTPLMSVMGIAFGLSHLASGDAFGAETSLPWGIELWGAIRHPSQIYETLLAVLILWIIIKRANQPNLGLPGETFLIFAALSAGARLFLEAFRGDSTLLVGGIRAAQMIAWSILAISLWLLRRKEIGNMQPDAVTKMDK